MRSFKNLMGLGALSAALSLLPACGGDDSDDTTGASTTGDSMGSTSGDSTGGTSDTDGTTGDSGSTGRSTSDSGGSTTTDSGSTGGGGMAMIRVMHLGAGVPAVDVFANDAEPAAVTDLDFREGTAYLMLPEASYTFQVSLTGMTPADAAIEAGPLDLMADTAYTAVAVGDIDDANLEVLPIVDDSSGIDAANLRLQVTHAASKVGQVDIWNVTDPNNAAPLLENVDYKASGTVDVPPGSYDIGIDVDDDATPDLVFTVDLSSIPAGTFIDMFASDDNEMTPGVALVALLDDANGTTLVLDPN